MIYKKIKKGIIGICIYLWANVIVFFHYDKKYLKNSWFGYNEKGRKKWLAIGWRWIIDDYRGCKRMNVNRNVPWPVSPKCSVIFPWNIEFGPESISNFQSFGIYFQGIGKIKIGDRVAIGPNVGIISSNHDPEEPDRHILNEEVCIGDDCWIGMNSVILPGVVLGPHTTVGAGSVVTKSFPGGYCVIGGNPAKVLKDLKCK